MDFEEFRWALGNEATVPLLRRFYDKRLPLDKAHRERMRDFRLYMLVGGMPQAVDAYIRTNNFSLVDQTRRGIWCLSCKGVAAFFRSIPAHLLRHELCECHEVGH